MRYRSSILLIFLLSGAFAQAEIAMSVGTNFVFSPWTSRVDAVWSDSLIRSKEGLIRSTNFVEEAWVETAPIAVGRAYRPPTRVDVTVRSKSIPANTRMGQSYVRYGVDGKHWSTWTLMRPGPYGVHAKFSSHQTHPSHENSFTATLQVARVDREPFMAQRKDWMKQDPDWEDDTDAYARWLLTQDPLFFKTHIPFIGYIQIRMEQVTQRRNAALEELNVSASWIVTGLRSAPRNKDQPVDDESLWHLKLE